MSKKQWKVIIVDDDPVVLTILHTVFLREGWIVATAENGVCGLRLIREQAPDLVVLDLMLPMLNGWEICKLLRKENTIPILMLTALDQEDQLIKGLQLGADDYVTKPFSPREVLAGRRRYYGGSGRKSLPCNRLTSVPFLLIRTVSSF